MNGQPPELTASTPQPWTLRHWGLTRFSLVVFSLCGLLFASMEVSATQPLAALNRFLFWQTQALCAWLSFYTVSRLSPAKNVMRLPPWLWQCLLGSLLYAAPAYAADLYWSLDPMPKTLLGYVRGWLTEWQQAALPVSLAWLLANLPWLIELNTPRPFSPSAAPPGAGPTEAAPSSDTKSRLPPEQTIDPLDGALIRRIPPQLRSGLIHVQSELQYLDLQASNGRALILGSLSEVERQFHEQGLRVHRSHFVFDQGVRRLVRKSKAWVCELSNGEQIPVSRRRAAAARERYGALRPQ